jgi:hypothetical protein
VYWTVRVASPTQRTALGQPAGLGARRVLYHAGMIAAALDDGDRARELLQEALGLDPSFGPLQAVRARETLADLP